MKKNIKNTLVKTHLYNPAKNIHNFYKARINRLKYLNSKEYRELLKRKSFYSHFLKKGNLVFDVGANTGNRTEAFLSIGTKVVAIEPQSGCISILKNRFGPNKNFPLFEGGMSDKPGEQIIHIASVDTISSMSSDWISQVKEGVFKDYDWNREEVVTVNTLDNLIEEYGLPTFIKIDVEGYELRVLKGLTQKVDYISYEFMFPKFYDKAVECLNYLETLGELECNFSWGESMDLVYEEWVNSGDFRKKIKEISDTQNFGDIYIRFL